MPLFLLSGPRGCGKTTVGLAVAASCSPQGLSPAGVLCPARFDDGRKAGIDLLELESGRKGRLAEAVEAVRLADGGWGRARFDAMGPKPAIDGTRLRYGAWSFDAEALARADELCSQALARMAGGESLAVFVDEIGKLELAHGLGFSRTLAALDALAGQVADSPRSALVLCRDDLADDLKRRWPGATAVDARGDGAAKALLGLMGFPEAISTRPR